MIKIKIDEGVKIKESKSAFISFEYNPTIVALIRNLPIRFYNLDEKIWEIPIKYVQTFIDKLNNKYEYKIIGELPNLDNKKVKIPDDFTFKTNPYDYQLECINYGINNDSFLLSDEQGLGKALALNTKIYTPDGYKLMKDLEVGDYVFGADGKKTKVTATYYHKNVEMYRFTFSDGVTIDCCKDHLWEINTQHGKKVVNTQWFLEKNQFGEIRKDKLFSGGSYNFYIDRCKPVEFNHTDVFINPYIIGALLGDGSLGYGVSFTSSYNEIINRINDLLPEGYILSNGNKGGINYNISKVNKKSSSINIVKKELKKLGLIGTNSHTKFIPDIYKYNSTEVRLNVLRGLIDTDGYSTKNNLLQYTSVSKQLIEDVRFLVESLGGICNLTEDKCGYNGKTTGIAYTLTIRCDNPEDFCLFSQKKNLLNNRKFKPRRNIISIEKIQNSDAKCITVDNEQHLYLAEHFVVTHNTLQVINIAVLRKKLNNFKHCLIICGVNSLKWNWKREIKRHSFEDSMVLGERHKRGKKVVIGNLKERIEDLNDLLNGTKEFPYFIITNAETLRNAEVSDLLNKICKKNIIEMCACDEIHKMKNPSSQQSKGFFKVNTKCKIAITGTPLLNTPLDLYVVLKWLGAETHAFYSFKNHYCVMGGFGGYEITAYKNMEQLTSKVNDLMIRRLKSDVLDLPDKVYVEELVEMDIKQSQIYKEAFLDIKNDMEFTTNFVNPLTLLIRLRQATGYTGILSSTVKVSAKLDRMEDLVEECVSNGDKCIIFSNWTSITDVVLERLKKYNCATITGNTKDNERQEQQDKFMLDENCKVIVGTIGAMGTGLTLTKAHTVIFLDEPWNKGTFDQAVDRAHRIGTTSKVTIYSIMCKDTIDERIHNIIMRKGELSDAIIDGKDIKNKKQVFDYLLG